MYKSILLSLAMLAGTAQAGEIHIKEVDADKLSQLILLSSVVHCEHNVCKYVETQRDYVPGVNMMDGYSVIYPDNVFDKKDTDYYAPEVTAFYMHYLEVNGYVTIPQEG